MEYMKSKPTVHYQAFGININTVHKLNYACTLVTFLTKILICVVIVYVNFDLSACLLASGFGNFQYQAVCECSGSCF